jgi:lipoprotein-anchoring transpeptidase ErfK/SrfK
MTRGATKLRFAAAILPALAASAASPAAAAGPTPAGRPASLMSPPPAIVAPSRAEGAMIADIVVAAEARSRPGGGRRVWLVGTATSWSGEPQFLLVLGAAEYHGAEWMRLLLPIRPDHSTGWIPRRDVTLMSTRYWVTVDKRARTVTVYRSGRRIHRYRAVIGKPATPTPDGLAAIYERDPQPDPNGFLGPWALPLTVFSNVLLNFGGGPGRIAIHGRAGASLADPLGSARSHGCIRIDNGPIEWMAAHLPQGTPVQIAN